MLLRMAWRNIWRNTRRTAITVLALALGVAAIVSIHSFREVANEEMIRGLTRGLVGNIQVHANGYQDSPEIDSVVRRAADVESRLIHAVPGTQVEQRVIGAGLAGSGDNAAAVAIVGIQPDNPGARALLEIDKGRTLENGSVPEAVVGKGLAAELGVGPGSELTLVGQAADGSLANDLYTVVGTADAGSYEANSSSVFLSLGQAQSFFALGDGVHQLIVRMPVEDPEDLREPVARLRRAAGDPSLEVLPWTRILPELKGAIDAKRKNQHVLDLVVFLIVALGVLNTMSMSTFERTREFGVLRSLGTRRGRILSMVVIEALLQGAIGLILGVIMATLILRGIGTVNVASLGAGGDILGARLPDALELRVHLGSVVTSAVTTLITVLAGCLVPAFRASRLLPVEATRYV